MNEETFRKRVYQFFEENKSKGKSFTKKRKDIKDRIYTKPSEDGISAERKV